MLQVETHQKPRKHMKKMTCVDLFAGAGGLSLGFNWAGFKTIYALEQDKWASETYAANHPEVKVDVRDIRFISDAEIKAMIDVEPDVIVGGPPCQGFSHANTANKDPKDPRNSLFQDFVRFARLLNPRVCVIENVPGLLKTKLADGTFAIEAIKKSFQDIGYQACWKVLNSAEYGVPQKRERLFIVAQRIDSQLSVIPWPEVTHYPNSQSVQTSLFEQEMSASECFVTLWDAISDLPQIYAEDLQKNLSYSSPPQNKFQTEMRLHKSTAIYNHEPMRHTSRITERFKVIGLGQSESDVPEHLRPRRRGGNGETSGIVYDQNSRRQDPDSPCSAIVASSHTNFIHPFLHRNFTVREMMRIQSFPDSYIVKGKRAVLSKSLSIKKGYVDDIYLDQRAQIGNAVPPKLAFAVGQMISKLLQSSDLGAA